MFQKMGLSEITDFVATHKNDFSYKDKESLNELINKARVYVSEIKCDIRDIQFIENKITSGTATSTESSEEEEE